jgi:putative ABC transport system permease protein
VKPAGVARVLLLVRMLILLYPPRFRRRFGPGMVQDFGERLRERAARGRGHALRWLVRALPELVGSALGEWFTPRGRPAPHKRVERPARLPGGLDALRFDLRIAVRSLARRPGLSAVTIGVLALGTGASTAMFSVVNAVLLQALPFADPDRLVTVWETQVADGGVPGPVAPADFYDWQERVPAFRAAAGYGTGWANLTGGEGLPEVLTGAWVTGNLFDVLGVRVALGRAFREAETWSDASPVILLSDGLWARRYGRDPAIVGARIRIDGIAREVVGVLPRGAEFPDRDIDVWMPMGWDPAAPGARWFRYEHFLLVVARLAGDATLDGARQQLATVTAQLEREYPATNAGIDAGITPLRDTLVGEARAPLLILFASTGLLLLLMCANVANLLLVRAAGRGREIALRAALGAGRAAMARVLVTETMVLALTGAIAGLGVAVLGVRALLVLQPPDAWRIAEVPLDARVLLFALATALISGLLVSLAPALRGAATPAGGALKDGVRASAGRRSRRASQVLVVSEMALALMLVSAAGLLLRSFVALRRVDPGFRVENRVAARVVLPERYDSDAKILRFVDNVVARFRGIPGVDAVTYASGLPLSGTTLDNGEILVEGAARSELAVGRRLVGPEYTEALGARLLRGRQFDERDYAGSEPVVIINQEAARRAFAAGDPIGKRITFGTTPGDRSRWWRIVGILADEHQNGVHAPAQGEAFLAFRQLPGRRISFVLHLQRSLPGIADAVRAEVAAADPELPLFEFQTLRQLYAKSLSRERFLLTLIGTFAALALALATIGVYGVTAEAAKQRTQEIGIRMALGARGGDVARLMLRQGLVLVVAGTLIGLAGALAGVQTLASVLYGVAPRDAVIFTVVPLALAACAMGACAVPAVRAARLDPLIALGRD